MNTGLNWLHNSSCLLTNASPPSAHHTWGHPSVGERVRKARVNGSGQGEAGWAPHPHPVALGSWEPDVWPDREASPLHRHLLGALSKGGRGCPWAQPESVSGGQGRQRGEGADNMWSRSVTTPRPSGACAQSCCRELASPDEKPLPLTAPAPSWPSSPISQPRRELSASPPVCWPARRKGWIKL